MDAYLYVLALAVFGVLYLVVGVFLVFTLLIALIAIYAYLVLRHGKLPDNYPFSGGDTIITAVFIGVTWGIFTLLGPTSPVPTIGSGLTYKTTGVPVEAVLLVSIVAIFAFLAIGAFIVPRLAGRGRSGGGAQSGGQQTVGAG